MVSIVINNNNPLSSTSSYLAVHPPPKRNEMPSQKQVVLISGANAGIGLAVANQIAKEHGYHVIIGSRRAAEGEKVAESLEAEGFSASSVQLDLTSDESIEAAVAQIEKEFGVLDVLINNAGILLDDTPGLENNKGLSIRQLFDQTYSTNVSGTAVVTEASIPLLRKVSVPRVVFVSSHMASFALALDKTTPWYAIDYKSYDASKAALNMLALNYARNLADVDAQVNVVSPGLVKTKLTNDHPYGTSTDEGAKRIVQVATSGKGGPTATFSEINGPIAW